MALAEVASGDASGIEPGDLPTRYRLEHQIGSGRNATVWAARDTFSGTDVAVKLVSGAGEAGDGAPCGHINSALNRDRFEAEARSLARLTGIPGVLRVYEVGVTPAGRPWMVSELLTGGSLAERIDERNGGVQPAAVRRGDCIRLFVALDSVHSLGVLHGDISPSNVLFDLSDDPVLTDFGMAALYGDDAPVRVFGMTPAFAAPERIRGARPSAPSDVYSMAATLLAALGNDPELDDVSKLFESIVSAPPRRRPQASEVARRLG